MRYALAPSSESTQSAAWLEGFLYGSGLLLIHHPTLWQVLDEWVSQTDMARLENLLPLLPVTTVRFGRWAIGRKNADAELVRQCRPMPS